jgi:hypothetical protein
MGVIAQLRPAVHGSATRWVRLAPRHPVRRNRPTDCEPLAWLRRELRAVPNAGRLAMKCHLEAANSCALDIGLGEE